MSVINPPDLGAKGRPMVSLAALLAICLLLAGGSGAYSQNIGNWTFNNTLAGVAGADNTVSAATFSSGISSVAYNGGTEFFGEGGWPSGTADMNSYLEFSLTPKSGFAINVSNLTLTIRRSSTGSPSGSGPTRWCLRSSVDGFTSVIADDTLIASYASYTVPAGSGFLNQPGTVSFRLYGYQSKINSGGYSRFVLDNITVRGVSATLPAIFGSVSVALQNNKPVVRYQLYNTTIGDRYTIERSSDGINF
ncbi:MAG: hypothetical protein JST39_04760, partial [Bacteroidetes bacterium]|nr:hypothetical protein [Bacteroidota bacterium]